MRERVTEREAILQISDGTKRVPRCALQETVGSLRKESMFLATVIDRRCTLFPLTHREREKHNISICTSWLAVCFELPLSGIIVLMNDDVENSNPDFDSSNWHPEGNICERNDQPARKENIDNY